MRYIMNFTEAGKMLCSRDISRLRADVAANCNVFLQLCKEAGLIKSGNKLCMEAMYI